MSYIHYGEVFDREKFYPIKNSLTTKPQGGFWVSEENAEFGWKEYVKDNELDKSDSAFFNVSDSRKNIISLKPNAKILVIDSIKSVELAEKTYGTNPRFDKEELEDFRKLGWCLLNFEEIAKCYDAIDFRLSDDHRLYSALFTWDCDSTLIMNPDIIQ